jgi:hypothetical protein
MKNWMENSVYQGESWIQYKRHGEGEMVFSNGNIYQGRWNRNRLDVGYLNFKCGWKYWGCFSKNSSGKYGIMISPIENKRYNLYWGDNEIELEINGVLNKIYTGVSPALENDCDVGNNQSLFALIMIHDHLCNCSEEISEDSWIRNDIINSNIETCEEDITEEILQDIRCPISLTTMIFPVKLSCGHSFCELSIKRWMKCGERCPLCNASITQFVPNKNLSTVYTNLKFKCIHVDRIITYDEILRTMGRS